MYVRLIDTQRSAASAIALRTPPLLRWAGSKKRQFNEFEKFFPRAFDTYVEPFAGSASFLFRLRPEKSKINDINSDLCDFYRYARTCPRRLYADFVRIKRSASVYYDTRQQFNGLARGFRRAVYFYFLNRNCFNGIYRTNKLGNFNVPFSDSRVSPYLTFDEFQTSSHTIRNCKIYNEDFEVFCRRSVGRDDFVFIDPPYYRDGSRIFNEYGTSVFAHGDFQRLTNLLRYLDKIGAKFLLSFPRTKEAISLETSWNSTTRYVRRSIAGNPAARRKQAEMLIFNYSK